ncbi:hypothetical protein AB0O01_24665 [Streptomyces sp. NPDC093252]|uniref:hypothetical protein n=1 Tax=Streptomyces sp. NPDC093252 TaxID=3154980 RepID=UPI0034467E56
MAESPQSSAAAPRDPSGYGWCAWHQNYARGVRLIEVIEQGSGPGAHGTLFACRPCRSSYGLMPMPDQP